MFGRSPENRMEDQFETFSNTTLSVAELDVSWHGLVTSEADQMTAPE
jgi:hypothetical protein